jgi:hypothetical protein
MRGIQGFALVQGRIGRNTNLLPKVSLALILVFNRHVRRKLQHQVVNLAHKEVVHAECVIDLLARFGTHNHVLQMLPAFEHDFAQAGKLVHWSGI